MNTQHILDRGTASTRDDLEERLHQIRSEIAKQAMIARVAAGECPGIAPLGYHNVVVENRRTVEVDPVMAPLVVEAFRLAAQRKSSLRKVLAELGPRGFIGRTSKTMGVSSLQAILTNPFYAGFIRHQNKLYRAVHQPLISRSLFDQVHRQLFRRRCR
jgi:site-specific DNA recombinase